MLTFGDSHVAMKALELKWNVFRSEDGLNGIDCIDGVYCI
jgi:hypothetical protein